LLVPLLEPPVLGALGLGALVVVPDELLLGELLLEPELLEPELPPLMPDEPELPPAAPVELEPDLDLLKCASHSAREIWPSLLVSTDEKLGVEELLDEPPADDLLDLSLELLLPEADGEEDEDDDGVVAVSLELLPEADGEDDEDDDGVLLDEPLELLPVAEGDDFDESDDEDDCAAARLDSANNTAAAVMLRVLGI
jgi:hypothetical protein